NLAMAGLIDRALLSPPAHIVHPDQVFTVGFEVSAPSGDRTVVSTASYPTYEAVTNRVPTVAVAAWHHVNMNIGLGTGRVQVKANGVTGNYFRLLGVQPSLGRAVVPDDDQPPVGTPVAVLSHSLWRSAFGGDPGALGQRIQFGALSLEMVVSLEMVGVMPAGFSGHTAERVDLWLPLSAAMHDTQGCIVRHGWQSSNSAFAA
ncbi:MAG TPA: ABC transporter permease, partial [Vicinamibacterales bacterium]|nr:ABC transporter permease [Vicinamibacterales bacterium]